jgi:hypothetical protein
MSDRLVGLQGHPTLTHDLFPLLLSEAGKTKNSLEVVTVILYHLYKYSMGKARGVAAAVLLHVPDIIDAMIPDKEGANEAKAFWEEVTRFPR